MDPALSRRVGRLMMTYAVRALDFKRHMAFVAEVSRATSFDDLPRWVCEIVLAGEEQFAEVQAQRPPVTDPSSDDHDAPRRQP
jgi:hypothetical protein